MCHPNAPTEIEHIKISIESLNLRLHLKDCFATIVRSASALANPHEVYSSLSAQFDGAVAFLHQPFLLFSALGHYTFAAVRAYHKSLEIRSFLKLGRHAVFRLAASMIFSRLDLV